MSKGVGPRPGISYRQLNEDLLPPASYPMPPSGTDRVPKTIGLERSAARMPIAGAATIRRELGTLVRTHWGAFAVVVLFQGICAVAALVPARVLGGLVQHLSEGTSSQAVDTAALLVLVALIIQTVFTGLTRYRSSALGERILATLRERFIARATVLPPGVVERAGTGELLTRTTTDVDRIAWAIRDAVPMITVSIVTVIVIAVALIWTAPLVALVWLVGVPIMVVSTRWYMRRAPQAYRSESSSYAAVNTVLAETVDAGRTVESLRLGPERIERTEAAISRWLQWESYTLRLRTRWFPTLEASYVIPLAAVMVAGGLLYINGTLTLQQATTSILYAQMLIEPVDLLLMWFDELQAGSASLSRLLGVHEIVDPDTSDEQPGGQEIEARDVRFGYREGKDVLHGIDLEVTPGARVAIVGPSGAGKSTFGRLLAGIHAPRAGSLTLGGAELGHLPTEVARTHVALVTQEHHVFVGTLRDNLILARRDATDDEVWAALDVVDAGEWARELPEGLDTEVGSGGHKLGAAQAQQVALARLVLADPHTLVLDEATSLLDPRAARHLERSLSAVLDGRTVVAIAHRLHTAHDADVIVVVEDGVVSEQGSHAELMQQDAAYAALWRSWRDEN